MPRVERLDPATTQRIAAGEVIERPVSVLKELLENALDAASTRIDIDLQNGGRRLIQVTDNGSGMHADEAVLALQRFTTSKIRRIEDLSTLTTLGFRGEALPSIATVAQVELFTRPAQASEGVRIQSLAEPEPHASPVGCPPGTRVCVHRLFAHVPVRLRALKSIAREVQRMQELVTQYALAYPHVTFHLRHDGRRLLFAPACPDLLQRLPLVFGRDLAAQMLPVYGQNIELAVHGVVGTPAVSRATRQRQYFWVNGRPIYSGLLSSALERAYGSLLPPGRRPVAALGVTLPPDLIDVNTHPRKSEIKFLHERAVFAAVQEAVGTVLHRVTAEPPAWQDEDSLGACASVPSALTGIGEARADYSVSGRTSEASVLQLLGQVGNTFIVVNGPQGLVLLDQHATHESLVYAQLMATEEASIELEETILWSLTAAQRQCLPRLQSALGTLGFHLEPFGRDTLIVRDIPPVLQDLLHPANFLEAMQEAQQRASSHAPVEEWCDHLSAALACRTVIRAGDALSIEQMTPLIEALAQQRVAYTCPHGRPTHVTLSLAELERRFLRLFPLDTSAGGC